MIKIGLIGMGNMGYAILKGLLKEYNYLQLVFTDVNTDRMQQVSLETRVSHVETNAECAHQCQYLILAVKPQYYEDVLKDIANIVTDHHIVISIAPGIMIAQLQEKLGIEKRIVRAMPNTPALVGAGMTGVCYETDRYREEERAVLDSIFSSFGKVKLVEERLMNAVVCVSGSSPAYVYMMIEALADGGVKYGLSRAAALEMAAQTVLGSAKMVLETGTHPAVLKDNVCSPGGTTIAAVAALEQYGFRNAIMQATDACYAKCETIK